MYICNAVCFYKRFIDYFNIMQIIAKIKNLAFFILIADIVLSISDEWYLLTILIKR